MSISISNLRINTSLEAEFINITTFIQQIIKQSNVKEGIVVVFCPHTTAGITINENADPDVVRDLLYGYDKAYPKKGNYHHFEGNSHAHLKASVVGASETIIIHDGQLQLGTWQGVYLCEFDGPRNRTLYIKIIEG